MIRFHRVLLYVGLTALTILCPYRARAAEAPPVRALRAQRVGAVTYFQVQLAAPRDLARLPALRASAAWPDDELRGLARLPRLVPQDDHTRTVYARAEVVEGTARPAARGGLEFLGRVQGNPGEARFLLLYPTTEPPAQPEWAEVSITLDLTAAGSIPAPAGKRQPKQPPAADDLEGLWATAQAASFAVMEAQAPGFGFAAFARAATGRKYGVRAPPLVVRAETERDSPFVQLYGLLTGTEGVVEALQLRRLLAASPQDRGRRTVDLATVPGISAPNYPWEKRMAGKKPAPEPLASLVPRDAYYLRFRNFKKFLDFLELVDQWGGAVAGAYEVHGRDYRFIDRYEKQVCLRDTPLVRRFGPNLVRSLAVIGSDPYLDEGTDVTVVIQVTNQALFLATAEAFIQEGRDEFGDQLRTDKQEYHGIPIESFVSPLREVSLYRAVFGEYVVHSNSPVALRRVLDAYQGRLPALADEPDFRYLRTVFQADDDQEDGLMFLSDAFIRQVVGPASKIKQKRRQEAMASLALATNGALFAAWEDGQLPADHAAMLAASGLRPAELVTPEGKGAEWDGKLKAAASDAYNAVHFAAPLIEQPIDKVTPEEARDYRALREDYLKLWRGYFDPVGIRLVLSDRELRAETLLMPLAPGSRYEDLQRHTGGGTVRLDVADGPADTLVQLLAHLSPQARAGFSSKDSLGDWAFFRLQDSAALGRLAELQVRQQLDPGAGDPRAEMLRLLNQLPAIAGVRVADRKAFDDDLHNLLDLANLFAGPFRQEVQKPAYKGVSVVRVQFERESNLARMLNPQGTPAEKRCAPAFFHAHVDGTWLVSFSDALLKEEIDRAVTRRDGKKGDAKGEAVEVHSSLTVAPKAVDRSKAGLGYFLEYQSHRRGLGNCQPWQLLYHDGLLPEKPSEKASAAAALRYFGFVPISPEGAGFVYDPKTDEVVNKRHGSLRRPDLHTEVEESAPLSRLLAQFRSMRADLRFRDDGVYATVTVERKAPEKK